MASGEGVSLWKFLLLVKKIKIFKTQNFLISCRKLAKKSKFDPE